MGAYFAICVLPALLMLVPIFIMVIRDVSKHDKKQADYPAPVIRDVTELPADIQTGRSLLFGFDFVGLVEDDAAPDDPDDSALPLNCPHCGGPVDPGRVKWVSDTRAKCDYCGTILGE